MLSKKGAQAIVDYWDKVCQGNSPGVPIDNWINIAITGVGPCDNWVAARDVNAVVAAPPLKNFWVEPAIICQALHSKWAGGDEHFEPSPKPMTRLQIMKAKCGMF